MNIKFCLKIIIGIYFMEGVGAVPTQLHFYKRSLGLIIGLHMWDYALDNHTFFQVLYSKEIKMDHLLLMDLKK